MSNPVERLRSALSDRYKIESELGQGGMATVYLAEDLKHKRKVAVKVLRPELAAVLGAERFVQEIETTANLQHPHILPLFDSGEADSFLYYVMPFIDGETVRDKLNRETQFGIDEAVSITADIADALDYAHRNNVIHRDIKPENILLHDGRPMVADFGIALAVSAAAGGRMTETGMSLGTPHYMSPEQATADKDLSNRSDIYSLGCVLYEMLTGEPPHTGASAQAIVMKIVTDEARPVTELRKSVPRHVAAAVAKSLQKLAADRFGTAKEFAEALTNPAFTLPTTQAAASRAPASRSWNRLSVGLAALAVALTLIAVWGWTRPEPARQVRRYRLALPEEQALQPELGSRIVLSPDGSRLVFVGPGDQGTQLWVQERNQLDATPLPGTDGAGRPFFSPDGERVGFFAGAGNSSIKVVSLRGGPPITVVDSGISGGGGTWGPDDFIYVGGFGPVMRVAASGGSAPQPVTTLDTARGEVGHAWPEALPNGKGVLFHAGGNIEVFDFATGERQVLVRGHVVKYASSGHLVYVTSDGTLMAAPFDQNKLALTGPETALVENVLVGPLASAEFTLSTTGTLVYTTGSGDSGDLLEPVWVARSGTAEAIDPGWGGVVSAPALSPDGTRLALSIVAPGGIRDIWIKQLDQGPLSKLTFEGANTSPAWTADGRAVTFVSRRSGNRDLYVKRADGVGGANMVLDLPVGVSKAFWSSNGDWLIYRTGTAPGGDIFARRSGQDSLTLTLVADPESVADDPALSPDGRWLAYRSNESGRSEVFVRPFPNAEDGKWQVSTVGGSQPVWAHSGRELFYRNGNNELVAVEIMAEPMFAVGEMRVLFSAAASGLGVGYDVTADDERFVMIRLRERTGGNDLILVENFFEELKEKVGG